MAKARYKSRQWFVHCPVSDKWHYGMHPHIYFICPDCKCKVHYEDYDNMTHELRQAEFTYNKAKEFAEAFDKVIANPVPYLIDKDKEDKYLII